MADLTTKQKILNASIQLFNENGLANVPLQQIADRIGISPGNLAYHFKNKEAILDAANEILKEECTEILSAYRLFPNLMDFDHQLSKYYTFTQKYPFYFLDVLELKRLCPAANDQRCQSISKMINQIRKRFDFNQQRGVFKKESHPGLYDSLADSLWILISFWHVQNNVRDMDGQATLCKFKDMVWNLIIPHLTKAGIAEYEQLIVPLFDRQA